MMHWLLTKLSSCGSWDEKQFDDYYELEQQLWKCQCVSCKEDAKERFKAGGVDIISALLSTDCGSEYVVEDVFI